MGHEVSHELGGVDGDKGAASTFDDEVLMWRDLRKADFAEFDADASALRGEMRRNGRGEAIGLRQSAIARQLGEA